MNDEIENNIQAHLGFDVLGCVSQEAKINAFVNSLNTKIVKATSPYGYYEPKVVVNSKKDNDNCLDLDLSINLSNPIKIHQLDIKITGDSETQKIFRNLTSQSALKKGAILIHSEYEALKLNLAELASELGYLDAEFTKNNIDIYVQKSQADIQLHFSPKKRYLIDIITIKQESFILDKKFIKNMINLKEKSKFTKSQLYNIRKDLISTGYFDQVNVSVDYSQKRENFVPVNIFLTAGDRIKYSTGLGFSTDTGARLSFDYQHNRITEYGYQFNSKLNLSEVISDFSTGIKIPAKSKALNKWSNVDIGYRFERTDNVTSNTKKLGFSQTRVHINKWQNINYIDLINEDFETNSIQNQSTVLVPGTSWSYVNSDNAILPKNGFKIQTDIKGASKNLLSDASFIQFGLNFKAIKSFAADHRFIVRTELGATYTNDFEDIPVSYRYFAGGDKSIRGFGFQDLGPRNELGEVVGGKNIFVAGIEYEYRIKGAWAGVLFTDFGNAFNNDLKIEKSIGTGVRWFSPIGPIRFDVGFPLNNERDFKIHISLGPDL